jgi:hypothetical protein
MSARPEDNKEHGGRRIPDEPEVERLLSELRPVELPPFYRTRLLARVRAAGRAAGWTERLRSPGFAWSVATVSVAALVVVLVVAGQRSGAPVPVRPGAESVMSAAAASNIDPVMPAGNSVVGAGDVEIVAAIYPPVEGGLIRLYVDDVDVTGLAEVTESYVMYSPHEKLAEGEHIVTIEIRDAGGATLKDLSWLFYAMNGQRASMDDRI